MKKLLLLLLLIPCIYIKAGGTAEMDSLGLNPVNHFTFNLVRSMKFQSLDKGSFVISPLSISFVLGMLNDGACGETKEEIRHLLECDVATLDSTNHAILREVTTDSRSYIPEYDTTKMKIADCLLLNTKCRLNDSYREKMESIYSALVRNADFKSPATINEINKWCRKMTDGKIPEIVHEINPDAYVYLLNTVYLSARWKFMFEKSKTKNEKFKTVDGKSEMMKMMHRKGSFEYFRNKTYSALAMDYSNGKFQMMILLPHKRKKINDIFKNMDERQWNATTEGLQQRAMDIKLPSFTIETNKILDNELRGLGLSSAYSLESADFKNICPEPLCISGILHRARIEVNEEGTKALSSTEFNYLRTSKGHHHKPKLTKFHATHPFLFAIKEKKSNTILFIGEFDGNMMNE